MKGIQRIQEELFFEMVMKLLYEKVTTSYEMKDYLSNEFFNE